MADNQRERIRIEITGRWVSGPDLVKMGFHRFGGRLHELRNMGYEVEKHRRSDGKYYYRIPTKKQMEMGF